MPFFLQWSRMSDASISNESNRTNNSVEGWNNQLGNYSRCDHPHLHKFVEVIKEDMTAYRSKIIQIDAGANVPPQRTKYKDHSSVLKNIVERFENDFSKLLDSMSIRLVLYIFLWFFYINGICYMFGIKFSYIFAIIQHPYIICSSNQLDSASFHLVPRLLIDYFRVHSISY